MHPVLDGRPNPTGRLAVRLRLRRVEAQRFRQTAEGPRGRAVTGPGRREKPTRRRRCRVVESPVVGHVQPFQDVSSDRFEPVGLLDGVRTAGEIDRLVIGLRGVSERRVSGEVERRCQKNGENRSEHRSDVELLRRRELLERNSFQRCGRLCLERGGVIQQVPTRRRSDRCHNQLIALQPRMPVDTADFDAFIRRQRRDSRIERRHRQP